jgi:hypothetical protein
MQQVNSFEAMLVETPFEQFKNYLKTVKSSTTLEYIYKYPPIIQYEVVGMKKFEGCEATICGYDVGSEKGFYKCIVYRQYPYWTKLPGELPISGIHLRVKERWLDTLREVREYMIENNLVKKNLIS